MCLADAPAISDPATVRLPPLTAESLLWLAGPVALSLATLVMGLALLRRQRPVAGQAVVVVSIAGLVLSGLWIALALRIEAVEHNSLGRLQSSPSAIDAGDSSTSAERGDRWAAPVKRAGVEGSP
jgi:predicted permease